MSEVNRNIIKPGKLEHLEHGTPTINTRIVLAAVIHKTRDALGRGQVCKLDYRTADRILAHLASRGIGAWVTRANPTDGQRVLIDLGADLFEVATYDDDRDEFIPVSGACTSSAIPSDAAIGWMALP